MTVMNTKMETLSDMLPPEDELEADLARLAELQELRAEVERLWTFVQKVALYSNDAWLAREADELAPGASL